MDLLVCLLDSMKKVLFGNIHPKTVALNKEFLILCSSFRKAPVMTVLKTKLLLHVQKDFTCEEGIPSIRFLSLGYQENLCCYVHVEMMGVLSNYNEEAKASHFENFCDSELDDISDKGIFEGFYA